MGSLSPVAVHAATVQSSVASGNSCSEGLAKSARAWSHAREARRQLCPNAYRWLPQLIADYKGLHTLPLHSLKMPCVRGDGVPGRSGGVFHHRRPA